MAGTDAINSSAPARILRRVAGRLSVLRPEERTSVLARREAQRFLLGARSFQGSVLALVAVALLCLLIPLHRWYGAGGRAPYFLLFALVIQIALVVLSARAVWVGMRHDAACGSLDELILTGAKTRELLLGKWLGVCAAGTVWTLALVPLLLLAAFTGARPGAVASVWVSWAVFAAAGGLVGTLLSLSERTPALTSLPLIGVFQVWLLLRVALPSLGASLGPVWSTLLMWVVLADPITLVPAAAGALREPWPLKVGTLVFLLAAAGLWIAGADLDLPPSSVRRASDPASFFSRRPVRAWLAGSGSGEAADYGQQVMYPFERAHGWRLRVGTAAWYCLLPLLLIPAVTAAILGRDWNFVAVLLAVIDATIAAAVGALGMAASITAEREQGRWELLLSAPLSAGEILRAKWRAVWLETWPLWAAAAVRGLTLALAGALPWNAMPAAALAPPVAAGVSAAVVALFCVRSPSLTTAQQRALLWLLGPPLIALIAGWLLPHLRSIGYVSLPHVLFSALRFSPGFAGPLAALAALGAYAALGALAFGLAAWDLRRRPPV